MTKKKIMWISIAAIVCALFVGAGGILLFRYIQVNSNEQTGSTSSVPPLSKEIITYHDEKITHKHVKKLDGNPNIDMIVLVNCIISEDVMEEMNRMKPLENLTVFCVDGGTIEGSPEFLNKQPKLSELHMYGCNITSEQLKGLKIPTLKRAMLDDNPDLDNVEFLRNCTELKHVGINNTGIEDLSMLHTKMLESLDISNTRISDISVLAHCTKMEYLIMKNTAVTDLSALAEMRSLKNLHISGSKVESLAPLMRLSRLDTLYASGCGLTTAKGFSWMWNLKTADLSNNELTDISGLQSSAMLEKLNLSNNRLEGDALEWILGLEKLTDLDLSGNNGLNLNSLSGATNITSLNINGVQTDHLNMAGSLPKLENLYAENCGIRDIQGLASCRQLKRVYLADNQIEDASVFFKLPTEEIVLIDLTGNRISNMEHIANGRYQTLVLQENPIRQIESVWFQGACLVVNRLENLDKLLAGKQFARYMVRVDSQEEKEACMEDYAEIIEKNHVNVQFIIGRVEIK